MQGQLPAVTDLQRSGFLALQLVVAAITLATAAGATSGAVGGQAFRDGSRAASDGGLLGIVQPRYHAVVLFDARPSVPQPLFAFGKFGRKAGELLRPTGVAIDARRRLIYVSDTDNDRIQVFRIDVDARGQAKGVSFAKSVGHPGNAPGEFRRPGGLALANGQLLICDAGNARIQVLDADLVPVRQITSVAADGVLSSPADIAVDATSETLYAIDVGRLTADSFDRDGRHRMSWGTPQNPNAGVTAGEFAFPFALATGEGYAYVSDPRRQDVQKFQEGRVVAAIGGPGNEEGRFFQPEGVTLLDAQRLLVIDQGGLRGQLFALDGTFLTSFQIPPGDLYPWSTPSLVP